jgi:hypothetical protein
MGKALCCSRMAIVVTFALTVHAVVHQEAAPIAVEKWCFRKDLSEGLGDVPADCTNLHLASKPITDEQVGAPATRPPMLARFARLSLAHLQYARLPQAKVLGHSLHHHKDVTTAFLTGTRLSEDGVRHIAHAIAGVRRRQRSLFPAGPSHRTTCG